MVRRHVLAALAAGIAAGSDDAARAALRRTEWLVRRRARRKLEAALIDAALLTNELGSAIDPEAARHVQRVAALAIARVPCDVTDRERVTATYAAQPKVVAPRFPVATVVTALVGLLAAGGIALAIASRPGPAKRTYERPLPPPVAGAYQHGGVPLADEPIEKLLTGPLTELVVATDRDRRTGGLDKQRKAASDALLAPPAITSKGAALANAWRAMIEMLDRWTTLPASDNDFDKLAKELRMRVRAVSDQLAAGGIGYYVEADMFMGGGTAHVAIYTYRVEEVAFVQAAGRPRRVLSLRRLDHINLYHSLLGMQSHELGDPVLLLDQIDHHVTTQLLPVLAADARYELADEAWLAGDPGKALSADAGAAVRTELAVQLGNDAAAAGEIGALLHERAELVDGWVHTLERRGWVMPEVEDLFVEESLLASLDGQVASSQLRRAREIDEEIARLEGARIASLCHQLVAATVRRHEAQHGLDDDREQPLRYPAPLEDLLGPENADDGTPRAAAERARAELSAYTSQIANDPTTPQLALWNVASFAFTKPQWGTAESYAAVVLLEALANHLQIPSAGDIVHDGIIDRERLAKRVAPMVHIGGDRLRAAAREAWKDLFGEDLVPITDR